MLSLTTACSSMQVQTGGDPQADLSRYKTYSWAPDVAPEPGTHRTLLDQTVVSAVQMELAEKGLTPAPLGTQPDLLISYYGVARNEVTVGGGYYGGWYPDTYMYRQGSLTLLFVDPRTDKVVWQGTASDAIGDAGASQEQVARAVDQLIQRYPAT